MRGFFALGTFLVATSAWALSPVPSCMDNAGNALPVNNDQVLQWKTSTPNDTHDRAHVSGAVIQIFPNHSGHEHFAISLGPDATSGLEVIYNQDFGFVPEPKVGDQVEACGDYITSNAPANGFPASPEGAIIHWVHRSPRPQTHPSGFIAINGTLYGQGNGN